VSEEERRERRATEIMATARALADSSTWLRRARETVAFSSARLVARTVEVDLTIPDGVATAYGHKTSPLVIGFVPRAQAGGVHVLDESGAALPTLTTVEADEFLYDVLTARIAAGRGGAESDIALRDSSGLATMLREVAKDPALIGQAGRGHSDGRRNLLDVIRADRLVIALLDAMNSSYPLVVELPSAAGRRVLTYRYEDALARRRQPNLRASLGWVETKVMMGLPGVPLAKQHEFAVEVPDGVSLTELRLIAFPGPSDDSTPAIGLSRTPPVVQKSGRFATASIDLTPHGRLILEMRLRPDSSYPATVLATAIAVALVLTAGLLRLTPLSNAPEAATAVLLAVPALFTTIVAQPVRGSPAARLLSGARLILILSGLLAYVAAVMIVLYPERSGKISSVLRPFWLADCGSAWILVALLMLPVIAPIVAARKRT
jgi:hypothetical protein